MDKWHERQRCLYQADAPRCLQFTELVGENREVSPYHDFSILLTRL